MHEEIFPQLPPPPDVPLQVDLCGVSFCDGSYRIRRTAQSPVCVFEYVRRGIGTLEVEGEVCHPAAGDLYIVPPFTNHHYSSSADNPWEKLWFNVTGPLILHLLEDYRLTGVRLIKDCPVGEIFREGLAIGRRLNVDNHRLLAPVIHRICMAASQRRGDATETAAARLKHCIDRRWQSPPKLEELARLIGRSPVQALRIFKREFGVTPGRYSLELRLRIARQYLENTQQTLRQIAAELGFCDEFYFSRLFKGKYGESPRACRRRFRSGS